jgi:hypothetical protein
VDAKIEEAVVQFAIEQPAYGQVRVAKTRDIRFRRIAPGTQWRILAHTLQHHQTI